MISIRLTKRTEKQDATRWLLIPMLILTLVPASIAPADLIGDGALEGELGPTTTPDGTEGIPLQLWEQIQKLTASDATANDRFGFSVATSGDIIVVGALGEDDNGPNSGAAYVFVRIQSGTGDWGEVIKITASDADGGELFGSSVAVSENTIIVGAPLSSGPSAGGAPGAAYVFERSYDGTVWFEVKKLTFSDGVDPTSFGTSVSISGDTVVVGASLDDDGGNRSGAAYVFERDQGGAQNWGQVMKLRASDAGVDDFFGDSVAINGDTVIVGAVGSDSTVNDSGSAYVFERDQGPDNWGQVKKLIASDAVFQRRFGVSVSISGNSIVVGSNLGDGFEVRSGSAYVFERDQGGAGNWGEAAKLIASDGAANDFFGISVSISGDAIVVGAELDDDACPACNSGSAYVFERDEGGVNDWGEVTKLIAADGAANDFFARSVSISGDTVVAGAHNDDDACPACNSGSAYIFVPPVPADLSITKADSADPATAGGQLTYTITARNFGPGDAQDVVVTDALPSGVTFVSTSGCAEDPIAVPTCTLGTILHGDFADYTVTVAVDSGTTGMIANQADVTSSTPEARPGDESVIEPTAIVTPADLSITMTDSVDPVIAGSQLTYSITVTNAGPGDAQDVVVIDTLPAGVTLVLTNGCAEDPLAVPTCTLGTLMAGTQTTYIVIVMVDPDTIGIITNQASVSASTPEANPGDESASETTDSIVSGQIFADGFESGDTAAWSSILGEL